jgi:hypothetical protein
MSARFQSQKLFGAESLTYSKSQARFCAEHLMLAMEALFFAVPQEVFVHHLAEVMGGPHWLAAAQELANELSLEPVPVLDQAINEEEAA